MLATRDDIEQYIPQRNPIIMIHELVEASDEHAVTRLHIDAGNVFVKNDFFQEPGMVENIAQTAAIQVGFIFKQKGIAVPIGYIAGIKDLRINSLPPVNSTITTSIKLLNQVLDVTLVEGTTKLGNEVICKCEMRIFVKK
jgi:predicted hotdog family 3-hydroxylacyl-ACP dehydratase